MDPGPPGAPKDNLPATSAGGVFARWYAALEARHFAHLTFQEMRRALQALSSLYVERRGRLVAGAALDTAGKRAAFALFYGPLHFLLVREIVRALGAESPAPARIVDLGCGTGAAGAAWALEAGGRTPILGIDRSPWVLREADWTYEVLGLRGATRRGDLGRPALPGRGAAILAAFTLNELEPAARAPLMKRLLDAGQRGARLLVIEPLARRATPFWNEWAAAFAAAGGRADTWRFATEAPERWHLLDRAAGMDHRELLGRSLYLA